MRAYANRMPWTKGYFETVGHSPIVEGDLLAQHCFLSAARGRYFDENFNELPGPVEPCGDWALSSYRWLDDQIADALGVDRAPE
jgi:hypothetical protein